MATPTTWICWTITREIAEMRMKNPPHIGGFIRREVIEPLGLSVTDAAQGNKPGPPQPSSAWRGSYYGGQESHLERCQPSTLQYCPASYLGTGARVRKLPVADQAKRA